MSTFLELVNDLRRECSVAGNGVATTLEQTGEAARLVQWIQQAHEDVQNKFFDWRFLKSESTFDTQLVTNIIQPASDLNIWDIERIYDDGGNQIEMIEYSDFNDKIDVTDIGKPLQFIIKNDNTLIARPYPDAVYTYTYDYFRNPLVFTADTDVPLFPAQYHRVIVARAMIYYGNYESAPEIKQQGVELFQSIMLSLVANQTAKKQQFYGRADAVDIQVVAQ